MSGCVYFFNHCNLRKFYFFFTHLFMNFDSSFLKTILHQTSNEMILVAGLSIIVLILLISIIRLHTRLSGLLQGNSVTSIEESLLTITKQVKDLEEFRSESEKYLTLVEKRLRNSIQSVETVRFNPFKGTGTGGNQSFATAFLNENGDGLIISSLYASDRMSIFAKPVKKMEPAFDLTEEEQAVFKDACENMKKSGK